MNCRKGFGDKAIEITLDKCFGIGRTGLVEEQGKGTSYFKSL